MQKQIVVLANSVKHDPGRCIAGREITNENDDLDIGPWVRPPRALKDAENALRDFIAQTLERALGNGWESNCGVTEGRLTKWRERKQTESSCQETGTTEERLLYYADFYDLKTILKKHWAQYFTQALGDWKIMEVLLAELEKLRDPDAHRRELLPHQHHFALGISGEIRTRISRYRSTQ